MNYYAEWSKAKLPETFINAVPTKTKPKFSGKVVRGELAEKARAVVEQFVQAMHDFESKWLKIRPIHELGYQYVQESMPGIHHWDIGPVNQQCYGFNANPMPASDQAEKKLELRKYVDQAVGERNAIWKKFCTDRPRSNSLCWEQHYPPAYDPKRDRVAEIVQKSGGDLIYMVPVNEVKSR